MKNSISTKPAYIQNFYFNTLNGLFWTKWALSWYIVGLDIDLSNISIKEIDNNRISLSLSLFYTVNLPEVGVQKNTDYDCLVWSEKKLFLRFRINNEGKISIIKANTQIIRPNLINIIQSSWESAKMSHWILSGLKIRISKMFWTKK